MPSNRRYSIKCFSKSTSRASFLYTDISLAFAVLWKSHVGLVPFHGINQNCIASTFTFSVILRSNTRSITLLHIPVTLSLCKIHIPWALLSLWKPVAVHILQSSSARLGHHFQGRGQRSRSPGRFGWLFKSVSHYMIYMDDTMIIACWSWIFIAQGALGAARGAACVRRVGYGLEVGRSVRTAGGPLGRGILCRHAQSYVVDSKNEKFLSLSILSQ